ncbi:TetR family transcriptional regulator [Pseudonocardia sp. CA-107938]|uniref:TetR family transcriptional regulator n=1 Tax=Pseudonocardia sp. CA-107938 TaxID=3240021 RepID=UPI003D923B46
MTDGARAYGGVAVAERRARRRSALLDAALDLLADGGAGVVTKRAVCQRARLNDRYFYEHFADRDALLETLAAEVTGQGIVVVVAAVHAAPPDVHARVRAAADAAIGFVVADPRHAALLLQGHSAEPLQRARQASQHAIARAMVAVAADQPAGPSTLLAGAPVDAEMIAFTVVSGLLELVAAWIREEFTASREHLTDLVARLLLAGVTR